MNEHVPGLANLQVYQSNLIQLSNAILVALNKLKAIEPAPRESPHAIADGMRIVIRAHIVCARMAVPATELDAWGQSLDADWRALITRVKNILSNLECAPIPHAVAELSERELRRFPNVGRKTVALIKNWLAHHGLELRP